MKVISYVKEAEKYNDTICEYIELEDNTDYKAQFISIYAVNDEDSNIVVYGTIGEICNAIDVLAYMHPEHVFMYKVMNEVPELV